MAEDFNDPTPKAEKRHINQGGPVPTAGSPSPEAGRAPQAAAGSGTQRSAAPTGATPVATPQAAAATPIDPSQRLLITFAIMAATVMQVLDTTIVNVALPHMQGELGATSDQMSWVLTSYLVSSAIMMPLTGYFTDIWGRKKYLMVAIAGFVLSSALCGISQNLAEIVFFRLLQGVFGAALVPLSQAIMVDTYPLEERGKAMAIWGMGVMVGPVLGPTLGGYLTEALSWRWTFYINVPVGVLSLFMAWRFVPDTVKRVRVMDWTGLGMLSIAIAGLQYTLDQGEQKDWFSSRGIQVAAALAVIGFIAFLVHSLRPRGRKLFNLRIFLDRNFAAANLLMLTMGVGLFGGMVIQPILIESLLNYPIVTTGLVMAPRGLATAASMMVVGRLVNRVDPRLLVGVGIVFGAIGAHYMTYYSLNVNNWWLIWPPMVQGLGLGMIMTPISTLAFSTLPRAEAAEAAGLYSLVRTIGSSIGISITTTLMTREAQVLWNTLGGYIQPYNPAVSQYLRGLHIAPNSPQAAALLGAQIQQQAAILSVVDVFKFIEYSFIVMLPLVFLMRRPKRMNAASPSTAAH
jgi:MFS transporter, DHA2 family, multidrug resistance protein